MICMLAAQLPQRRRVERAHVDAVEPDRRRDVGSMSRRIARPSVVLPHPDSPTMPSVSPRRDVEATRRPRRGPDRVTRAEEAALDREVLREVANRRAAGRPRRRRRAADGRRHAAVAPRCAASGGVRLLRGARARRRGGSATRGRRRSDTAADAPSRSAPTRTGSGRGSGSRSASASAAAPCRGSPRGGRCSPPTRGIASSRPSRVRMVRLARTASLAGASSTTSPPYITSTRDAALGDDAEVVRDEQRRTCRAAAAGRRAARGSAPGS